MYGEGSRQQLRRPRPRRDERYDVVEEDIFFTSRSDAEMVLGKMIELIAEYNVATVGDLNNLVGLGASPAAESWGWYDLSRTRIAYTTEGYLIQFPDAEYLR
jgi:hypothetical protein